MVKSGALTNTVLPIPVKIYGRLVVTATNTTPIHSPPKPVFSAMTSPYLATRLPLKKIIIVQIANFNQTIFS